MNYYKCSCCGFLECQIQEDKSVDMDEAYFTDLCASCFKKQPFVRQCQVCELYRFKFEECAVCQIYCCYDCDYLKACKVCLDFLCPQCVVCSCEINSSYLYCLYM